MSYLFVELLVLLLFYDNISSATLLRLSIAVRNFDRSLINAPGPCVLFATPGMIVGGFSLEVFMQWAPSENNLVTLPGYGLVIRYQAYIS